MIESDVGLCSDGHKTLDNLHGERKCEGKLRGSKSSQPTIINLAALSCCSESFISQPELVENPLGYFINTCVKLVFEASCAA